MRIIIPRDPNEIQVLNNEGENITDQLNIKELSLTVNRNSMPTTVQLTCYVDSIELLETLVEVTIYP